MIFSHSKLLNNFANLTHTFTSKIDGNLAFHVNDDLDSVIYRHKTLANKLSYDIHSLIHMKQVHSDLVHVINENDNFDNPQTCDALITDKKNIPLMVMVADCSPILFYDDSKCVIGVAHAGRQGAFKNIVQNVIDMFIHKYNSNTKDIYVSIGASISKCCYEVGREIYAEAKKLKLDYAIEKKEDTFYLNISQILKKQLLDTGIQENNIEISSECTSCKNEKYFSFRADSNTGRFSGIIMLN